MPEARPHRVLVCDDETAPRAVLATHLSRCGFEVHAAADGLEACAVVEDVRPDVVLLDLMLPKRDGYTVLCHLRGRAESRETPVFIVSAEPRADHVETARAMGAWDYIQKPFDLAVVVRSIHEALGVGEAPGCGGETGP